MKAWKKWSKRVVLDLKTPLFMEGNDCFTGRDFNAILTTLTAPITNNTNGIIRSHSFRSGMATEMGLRGFTDSEIQAQVEQKIVK